MHYNFPTQAAAVFVCQSNMQLQHVCQALQVQYRLPVFVFNEHSSWEYARSIGQHMGFNVTKTEHMDTIQQWMPNAPIDVNYQIILYITEAEAIHSIPNDQNSLFIEDVQNFLVALFQIKVTRLL